MKMIDSNLDHALDRSIEVLNILGQNGQLKQNSTSRPYSIPLDSD